MNGAILPDLGDVLDTDLGELDAPEVNERFREFKVTKPVLKEGTYTYTVEGYTKDGPFSVSKRYSDFDKLRTLLVLRWPGFYIPSLPEKKAMVSALSTNLHRYVGQHRQNLR